MTLFDERERAFENLFAHQEELRFLIQARRNQLFGRWAAEQIGVRGSEFISYVGSFVEDAVHARPDSKLVERVSGDFLSHGVEVSHSRIVDALYIAAAEAMKQVRTGIREIDPFTAERLKPAPATIERSGRSE